MSRLLVFEPDNKTVSSESIKYAAYSVEDWITQGRTVVICLKHFNQQEVIRNLILHALPG